MADFPFPTATGKPVADPITNADTLKQTAKPKTPVKAAPTAEKAVQPMPTANPAPTAQTAPKAAQETPADLTDFENLGAGYAYSQLDNAKADAVKDLEAYASQGEFDKLGSCSGDVTFLYVLGDPNDTDKKRVGTEKDAQNKTIKNSAGKAIGIDEDCSKTIGFAFRANKDVSVPVVKGPKTTVTGFEPEDVTEEIRKKGEIILFTYLELLLFAIRPQYSGCLGAEIVNDDGTKTFDPKGFKLSCKMPTYVKGDSKLPSPSPRLSKGAVKEVIIDVCKKRKENKSDEPLEWTDAVKTIENGKEVIKSAYRDKFGCFLEKKSRTSGKHVRDSDKDDKAIKQAAILRAIVNAHTKTVSDGGNN